MDLITIYEFSSNLLEYLILPIIFISIIIVLIWFILFMKKRPEFLILSRRILIFFSFIFIVFSSIFLIVIAIKLPAAFVKEKHISNSIKNNQFKIVEGKITCFTSEEIAGQHLDQFIIGNTHFTHSRFEKLSTPWKTKVELESPLIKGKYYRVSYITIDSEKIILKIETER